MCSIKSFKNVSLQERKRERPEIQCTDRDPKPKSCINPRKHYVNIQYHKNHCSTNAMKNKFVPNRSVRSASFWYLLGSSASFPSHRLFHAKTTAITHGPSTIWFNKTCKTEHISTSNIIFLI